MQRKRCRGMIGHTFKSFPYQNEQRNRIELFPFQFNKRRNDTILKITGNFDHRVAGAGPNFGCVRWFFLIDGLECSDPRKIEALAMTYIYEVPSNNHRRMNLMGVCRATASSAGSIRAGQHRLSLGVAPCVIPGTVAGDASTGWMSSSTFIVEEYCT